MSPTVPSTMTAAVIESAGQPPVLARRPVPAPGPNEVLVRVMAASVNPTDVATWRRGVFVTGESTPFVNGFDMAGMVVAVGRGVTVLRVGDAVTGMPRFPHPAEAFAGYASVPARHVATIPHPPLDDLAGWAKWGALPLAGLTAWQALVDTAGVSPGMRVLIPAASGGVGQLAVQLAAHLGAEVTAVTSKRGARLVGTLGAAHVVDRGSDWTHDYADAFDVVLDTIGGEFTASALELVPARGQVVALHPYAHDELAHDPRLKRMLVEPDHAAMTQLVTLHRDGKLAVHVGATFPLDRLGDALLSVADAAALGKTVIHPHAPTRLTGGETTMTRNTRETVDTFFEAFGRGDLDQVKNLFADTFTFTVHGGPSTPWVGQRSRRSELDEFVGAFSALGPATEYTVNHLLVDDDHAVALGRNAFPVTATGKSFTNDFALHFTVTDGHITAYQMYEDSHAIDQAFTPTE